jgi:hypothetical protein
VSKLSEIYRRNIYGVMGTLVFHILLVSAFLLAEVDMKGNIKEKAILIEFPDNLPEPEKVAEQTEDPNQDNPSQSSTSTERTTNIASNRLATQNTAKSVNEFLNEDYLKEVEAAKKLVTDVNQQLSKEIKELNDIKMPVETTTGMSPDSIKNKNYSGESNVVYYLENRYHLSLPIPVYLSQAGGKVIVDIVVNQQGIVIQATPRVEKKNRDEQTYLYAKAAALRTVFNTDLNAPAQQKGSIHYTFIPQ